MRKVCAKLLKHCEDKNISLFPHFFWCYFESSWHKYFKTVGSFWYFLLLKPHNEWNKEMKDCVKADKKKWKRGRAFLKYRAEEKFQTFMDDWFSLLKILLNKQQEVRNVSNICGLLLHLGDVNFILCAQPLISLENKYKIQFSTPTHTGFAIWHSQGAWESFKHMIIKN